MSSAHTISNEQEKCDLVVKLLLLGDSGTGKSNLLLRFADMTYNGNFITTIGIDFKIKTILIDGKRVKLQVWDTAGQERFRTITSVYYRGAMAILFVYDITDQASFKNITSWIHNVNDHEGSRQIYKVLIGNKCDLSTERMVQTEEGAAMADDFKIPFLETSAKDDINVTNAFEMCAREILKTAAEPKKEINIPFAPQTPRKKTVDILHNRSISMKEKCCK